MNKIIKSIITIFGAVNIAFNMLIPIALCLTLLSVFSFGDSQNIILLVVSIMATIYRAIEVGYLRNREVTKEKKE
jgi:phosphoglycerol transferase MdoB-like AlkP superfamily enzyme